MKNFNFKSIAYTLGLILITGIGTFRASAQSKDSLAAPKERVFKNIVKVNVTNWLIYDNSFQFSYERMLKKNRSISVFGGYQEFPLNIQLNLNNVELARSIDKSGYALGFDYRFYLAKENKYAAPHGVYLSPYISFLHFNTDRTLTYDNNSVIESTNLNTQINILNIGGSMGYQFVIHERWVIDAIVFGPAISSYEFKAKLSSNLPGLDSSNVSQDVIDAIKEKFPLLNTIVSGKEGSKSGTQAFWSGGFRYNISIGYRF